MKKYTAPEIAKVMCNRDYANEIEYAVYIKNGEFVAPCCDAAVITVDMYAPELLAATDDDDMDEIWGEIESTENPRYVDAVEELTEKVNAYFEEQAEKEAELAAPVAVSLPVVSCWATEWEADGITPANVVGGAVLELPSGDLVTVILDGDDELLPDMEGYGYHHAYGDYRIRIFAPEHAWELWETSFRGEDAEWADEQCAHIEKLLGVSYLAIYKATEAAVDFARAQNRALGLTGAEIYPSAWAPYEE